LGAGTTSRSVSARSTCFGGLTGMRRSAWPHGPSTRRTIDMASIGLQLAHAKDPYSKISETIEEAVQGFVIVHGDRQGGGRPCRRDRSVLEGSCQERSECLLDDDADMSR
jgi:hypothetical protein